MKKLETALLAMSLALALNGCATTTGAAAGAGVGYLAGDAEKGAIIGGSVGAVIDIVD